MSSKALRIATTRSVGAAERVAAPNNGQDRFLLVAGGEVADIGGARSPGAARRCLPADMMTNYAAAFASPPYSEWGRD